MFCLHYQNYESQYYGNYVWKKLCSKLNEFACTSRVHSPILTTERTREFYEIIYNSEFRFFCQSIYCFQLELGLRIALLRAESNETSKS